MGSVPDESGNQNYKKVIHMKLAINTGAFSKRFGDLGTLNLIKKAGFDAFDFTIPDSLGMGYDEYKKYIEKIKAYSEEVALPCVQTHAPETFAYDEKTVELLIRSIEYSAILGAEICVVHPLRSTLDTGIMYYENYEEIFAENKKLFGKLIPAAKKFKVKIAIENMFGMDLNRNIYIANTCSHTLDFQRYIDYFGTEYITACLDTGHAALVSEVPSDMIVKMGDRIGALHVQDVDFVHDLHTLPYMGALDWDAICKALKKINYRGNLVFEIGNSYFSPQMDDSVVRAAAKFAGVVGKSLVKKIVNGS